ncbi:MAG: RNA-directed DNA polymerase [Clostridiaceae bacterium]|nr:RNA-directed DNA polymerase [Clostridiaceae bacterium]
MSEFDSISSYESLYKAHRAARLGKRDKSDVIKFEMRLSENLYKLKDALESETYVVSGYHNFLVFDPKTREIQALRYHDRVVQHAVCDGVLSPYFERRLIYDNAACRKGKGTHFAMDRLNGFLCAHYAKHGLRGYALKCDISKYFDNIDHTVLKLMLSKCGFEPKVERLLFNIIDSYEKTADKGLPIGNQTSQYFALFYLDSVDRLIKERLQIKHYTRYMDDFILIHHDKKYLQACLAEIKNMCEGTLGLNLNPKTQIFPLVKGVPYLGFRFHLSESGKPLRILERKKKIKLRRMVKCLLLLPPENNEYVAIRLCSARAHLAHGNEYKLSAALFPPPPMQRA